MGEYVVRVVGEIHAIDATVMGVARATLVDPLGGPIYAVVAQCLERLQAPVRCHFNQ